MNYCQAPGCSSRATHDALSKLGGWIYLCGGHLRSYARSGSAKRISK